MVAYHVAPAAARAAILEHGLLPAQPNGRWARYGAASQPGGMYLWQPRQRALRWAHDMARLVGNSLLARNDVWQVDVTGLPIEADPVLGDQGAYYLPAPVPPARLTLLATV